MSHPVIKSTRITSALLFVATQAVAAPDTVLEKVVVTDTRFRQSGLVTPIGVETITAADIANSSATNLGEVLSKVGGVQTRINFMGTPDSPLDLRGFGMTGDQNTLVLIDGIRLSENELSPARLTSIPLEAIERIEIIRGAGAVLYGSGATGGVINIITSGAEKKGTFGHVAGTVGSYGQQDLRGSLNVGGENLALRLDANQSDADGYRKNNASHNRNLFAEVRIQGTSGSLALKVGDDRLSARLPGARTQAQLDADPRGTSTPNDYATSDGSRWTISGDYRLAEWAFSADLTRRNKRNFFHGETPFGNSDQLTDVVDTSFSPRAKWESTLFGFANTLILGTDWSDWTYHSTTAATGFFSSRDELGHQTGSAYYVQDQMNMTPRWKLAVGLRQERLSQSTQEALTPIPRSEVTHHLNARDISTSYDLGAGLAAFARTARSYRVANVDENRCYFAPCSPLLAPQTSEDQEIGIDWKQGHNGIRITLFESKLRNEIYYNNLTFSNSNLSPTERRGVEVSGQTVVAENIDLSVRYAYTEARFDQGVYGGVDVSGKEVPLVPKNRAIGNIGWRVTRDMRASAAVTYVGEQRYDNDPANRYRTMPAYTLVDLKLARQYDSLKISGGVNNVFDKRYYSYGITNSSFAPTTFNAYPEQRRTFNLSAEYRF